MGLGTVEAFIAKRPAEETLTPATEFAPAPAAYVPNNRNNQPLAE